MTKQKSVLNTKPACRNDGFKIPVFKQDEKGMPSDNFINGLIALWSE